MIRKLPAILCLALAGCASKSFTPDQAPEYIITTNFSPFYRMGPMQPGGPDGSLPKDTRVKMISQEMGFSRVQLEDMRAGYVANENIAPAPPKPPEPAASVDSDNSSPRGNKKRGSRYTGAQVNDTPLPDPGPPPDLNIAPEIVPSATPTPEPVEPPKFRY